MAMLQANQIYTLNQRIEIYQNVDTKPNINQEIINLMETPGLAHPEKSWIFCCAGKSFKIFEFCLSVLESPGKYLESFAVIYQDRM